MKINQIIVLKETREGEGRVALTPSAVAALIKKHPQILIESGAGVLAGFKDEEYIQAGAGIFKIDSTGFPTNSLLLRVKRPNKEWERLENKLLSSGTIMMGFLDPFDVDHENHMTRWHALGITTISLELLQLTVDDPRNAQAAMSRFAGKLALQDALQHYHGTLPRKVTVLGTGPGGLSAAITAKNLQLPVQLFGRQERYRETVEAAGIIYYTLPEDDQLVFIRAHLRDQTIVIAAARNVGKKSPILIDAASLAVLPEKAVIVDLTAGEGGCVVGSKEDKIIVTDRSVSIINVSGYPKLEPRGASEAYAQCIVNLLMDVITPAGELDLENTLLKQGQA